MNDVCLRPADGEDAGLVFAWRNDPFIVARSSSQRTVDFEEHQAWYRQSLQAGNRLLFIAEVAGDAIGLIRFDRESDAVAVISAYLLERFTGKGYGPRAIREGCLRVVQSWAIEKVIACVRKDNAAGQSGFRKAGFVRADVADNCPARHVCFSCSLDRQASAQ